MVDVGVDVMVRQVAAWVMLAAVSSSSLSGWQSSRLKHCRDDSKDFPTA